MGGVVGGVPGNNEPVVGGLVPAVHLVHLAKGARHEGPLVQAGAADTERMLEVLTGPGGVAVEGDGQVVDAQPRHGDFLLLIRLVEQDAAAGGNASVDM